MGIVRSDRRVAASESIAEARGMVDAMLIQGDAALAALEDLEIRLGLAGEAQVDSRGRYTVVHVPEGEDVGHELSECEDKGCETIAAATGGETPDANDPAPDDDP